MTASHGPSTTRDADACQYQPRLHQAYRRMLESVQGRHGTPDTLGAITLRSHQRQAIGMLRQIVARFGGALLADNVGTGKTYCALGVAAQYAHVLVVAPAALRNRWRDAAEQAGQHVEFVSFQTLSRNTGDARDHDYDLVIVDEAHHARTRTTRRYAALATLTHRTPVLLMSATPVHNRVEDLHALFALFLGSGVCKLHPGELAPLMLRRQDLAEDELPAVAPLCWHTVAADPQLLDAVLRIPSPLPAADEGQAAALSRFMLLRQWCSSDAALAASLDRMRRRAIVFDAELSRGRLPTKRDIILSIAAVEYEQLTLNLAVPDGQLDAHLLKRTLQRHLRAVVDALNLVQHRTAPATTRWSTVAAILDTYPSQRAVLFTHSIDTARSCFGALMRTRRVACLDGDRARVASGRVRRSEVIASFRPGARATRAMSVDALVATDVLSEGIDLHDANVLIHLDLPWTMARVEQRLGRLRRIGSPHQSIFQHALSPPAAGNGLIRILERLATKAQMAAEHIRDDPIFMRLSQPDSLVTRRTSDLSALLRRHLSALVAATEPPAARSLVNLGTPRRPGLPGDITDDLIIACAHAPNVPESSFLAQLNDGRLVCGVGDRVTASSQDLAIAFERATTMGRNAQAAHVQRATAAIERWLQLHDIIPAIDSLTIPHSDAHTRILQAIDSQLSAAPRYQRAHIAAWADRARESIATIRGAGAERPLEALAAQLTGGSARHRNSTIDRDEVTGQLSDLGRPLPRARSSRVVTLVLLTASNRIAGDRGERSDHERPPQTLLRL